MFVTGKAVESFKKFMKESNEWRVKQGKSVDNYTEFLVRLLEHWEFD